MFVEEFGKDYSTMKGNIGDEALETNFFDMHLTLPRKRRVSRHGTLKYVVQSESVSRDTPAGINGISIH